MLDVMGDFVIPKNKYLEAPSDAWSIGRISKIGCAIMFVFLQFGLRHTGGQKVVSNSKKLGGPSISS